LIGAADDHCAVSTAPSPISENAIGDIARVRGVSKFSRETGLSCEAIYKAFRPGGNPTIETVNKAMQALGLRLKLAPSKAIKAA
jgi:probable addiction module antidote protein